jgi:hypothetical protein
MASCFFHDVVIFPDGHSILVHGLREPLLVAQVCQICSDVTAIMDMPEVGSLALDRQTGWRPESALTQMGFPDTYLC